MEVPKPVMFTIEAPKKIAGGGSGDQAEIQKAASLMRAKLMKFPGALSVKNAKINGETAIVISVKKSDKAELPNKLDHMDFVSSTEDGKTYAEYKLKEQAGYKVYIQPMETKVKSLCSNKNKIGQRSPIKAQKKRKRAVKPAAGSPSKWPTSGFKLPRSKNVPIAKPVSFIIEGPKHSEAKSEKAKVKRAANEARPVLMKFPGARRLRCLKSDGKFCFVLKVKSVPSKLPEIEGLEKQEGSYVHQKSGYKVLINADKQKVKALRAKKKKYSVKPVKGIKWVKKVKPSVAPTPAPGTESAITGGCKLAKDKTSKPNFTAFFVEVQSGPEAEAKEQSEKKKFKKLSIQLRPTLMSYPNSRRLKCTKYGGKFAAVIYVDKKQKELPSGFSFMDLQEGPCEKYNGKYLLKDKPVDVLIKTLPKINIKSLKISKRRPKQVTGKKWVWKQKLEMLPDAAPGTETEFPSEESKLTPRDSKE